MEYAIEHQTSYRYPEGVAESYTVVHLQPRSDQYQYCTRFVLELTPLVHHHAYMDWYGNDVQHFAILPRHGQLAITTYSTVVTLAERAPAPPDDALRRTLLADPDCERYYDFINESTFVRFGPELTTFRSELGEPGETSAPGAATSCRQSTRVSHSTRRRRRCVRRSRKRSPNARVSVRISRTS